MSYSSSWNQNPFPWGLLVAYRSLPRCCAKHVPTPWVSAACVGSIYLSKILLALSVGNLPTPGSFVTPLFSCLKHTWPAHQISRLLSWWSTFSLLILNTENKDLQLPLALSWGEQFLCARGGDLELWNRAVENACHCNSSMPCVVFISK